MKTVKYVRPSGEFASLYLITELHPELYFLNFKSIIYRREVLKEIDDISEGIGMPDWKLASLLFCSWVITFLVSSRGVKSSGKAAYFLALFPYVIIITLLIRAATLEGASNGMFYFIETDWNRLLEAKVSTINI